MTVTTQNGDTYTAKYVVAAAQPRAVAQISFTPPLPAPTAAFVAVHMHVIRTRTHVIRTRAYACDSHTYACDSHTYACDSHTYACDSHTCLCM